MQIYTSIFKGVKVRSKMNVSLDCSMGGGGVKIYHPAHIGSYHVCIYKLYKSENHLSSVTIDVIILSVNISYYADE